MPLEGDRRNVAVQLSGNALSTLKVCSFWQAEDQLTLAQARQITIDQLHRQCYSRTSILFDAEPDARTLDLPVRRARSDMHARHDAGGQRDRLFDPSRLEDLRLFADLTAILKPSVTDQPLTERLALP